MFSKKYYPTAFIFLLIGLISCSDSKPQLEQYSLAGSTMGTTYSIKMVRDKSDRKINSSELNTEIDSLLRNINQQMSTYINDSEISNFNKYNKTEWFNTSSDFAYVLEKALYVSDKSRGAFDITIGPLVNLWGFGPGDIYEEIPSKREVESRLKLVGYKNLAFKKMPSAIKKNNKNIYIDLSAIAKGFAVDKVTGYLDSNKINNYMVEIGGEISTKGRNSSGKEWQIGIATPDYGAGLQKIVSINNYAMATSGDYLNYFEKQGIRYSHTIDPRTGNPITHNLASVTVVHSSCMIADAMATAISVMGPDEGFAFALNEKLPVFMIVREDKKFVEKMTPNFKQFLAKQVKD